MIGGGYMAIEVFNRFEKKFFMNSKTYFRVSEELKKYMELDPYSEVGKGYTISNIYYDTSDDLLVRRSLSKPVYKEKLRLRGYGVPEENGKVYLEIKKKFNGLVNKRRTTLYLNEAYDFIKTGKVPDYKEYMNLQVLKEIEYFLKCYKLVPAAYVAYDRVAYFEKDNPDLRISLDTNLRTRRYDLELELGDYGEPLLDSADLWLMEVKTSKTMPVWLTDILSNYNIIPCSFSKYGYGFKKSVGAYTPMLKRITAKAGSYVEAKEKYSAVRESGNIITADFEQNFSKGYKTANA